MDGGIQTYEDIGLGCIREKLTQSVVGACRIYAVAVTDNHLGEVVLREIVTVHGQVFYRRKIIAAQQEAAAINGNDERSVAVNDERVDFRRRDAGSRVIQVIAEHT